MCGIVGAIGEKDLKKYLINGLKALDYRGYDSAGISLGEKDKILTFKEKGSVEDLEKSISYDSKDAILGIGHTRWATHGIPSKSNSHPHTSCRGTFTVVHNGVIENFRSLKEHLLRAGYTFKSETDTEVIANLLEYNFDQTKDVMESLRKTLEEIKGSFALVIMVKGDTEHLYYAKNRSPLLIGDAKSVKYIASDAVPMIKYTNKFIDVKDFHYGYVTKEKVFMFKDGEEAEYGYTKRSAELLNRELGDYPHYMLKEIEEAEACIQRLIDNYFDGEKYLFDSALIAELRHAKQIVFLACGTSYHACLVGKHYFERTGKRVDVLIASEWAYDPIVTSESPLFVVVSQSGETADLIKCLDIINHFGGHSLTITNTKGSTLEREATYSLLLFAGIEVAVASTKAYTAQVTLLSMLRSAISNQKIPIIDLKTVVDALRVIMSNKSRFKAIAEKIKTHQHVFFIGRGLDYAIALEASLKLKEITYIHSEALPGGELKHGPIALITEGTPVFAFISNQSIDLALRSNICEVEARGADVITIVASSLAKDKDDIIVPNVPPYLAPLTMMMVAQYISYYTALALEVNIDKPRNLAKSVTVE